MDRWRIEEVGGYFDGSNTSDVYEFIDRLNSIASTKSPNIILKNIDTCFIKHGGSKEAYNWWIGKTSNDTRKTLQNHNTLFFLCSAFEKRSGLPENQLLDQSTRMTYTPKDVSKSATGFVGQVMMLCHRIDGDTEQYTWVQSTQMALDRFKGPLRNTLTRPTGNLDNFIKDVRTRHQGWHEQYAYYGKKPSGEKDENSSPRYAKRRHYNIKFKATRFKDNDNYRPVSGSARKALPAPDPSKVYHLRHDDSDSDPTPETDNH